MEIKNKINSTLILFIFICGTTKSQNLILNGDFNNDINHWNNIYTNSSWVDNDGAYSANGSLRFGSNLNNGGSQYMQSDLFAINAGYQYIFGASFKKPAASMADNMFISIDWFDANEVFLETTQMTYSNEPILVDTWYDLNGISDTVNGASHAAIRVWVTLASSGITESFAYWDDIFFYKDTIFKNSFEYISITKSRYRKYDASTSP